MPDYKSRLLVLNPLSTVLNPLSTVLNPLSTDLQPVMSRRGRHDSESVATNGCRSMADYFTH